MASWAAPSCYDCQYWWGGENTGCKAMTLQMYTSLMLVFFTLWRDYDRKFPLVTPFSLNFLSLVIPLFPVPVYMYIIFLWSWFVLIGKFNLYHFHSTFSQVSTHSWCYHGFYFVFLYLIWWLNMFTGDMNDTALYALVNTGTHTHTPIIRATRSSFLKASEEVVDKQNVLYLLIGSTDWLSR